MFESLLFLFVDGGIVDGVIYITPGIPPKLINLSPCNNIWVKYIEIVGIFFSIDLNVINDL